ncbi:hypothetical protein NCC49_003751 [Naganishia albida]|nr:hypothetical protein NCC49_003751 [Naganishia albida]
MPIRWPGKPSILERAHDDIITLVAEQLAESDAYGSIAALCATSHELKRVLQPFMAERKKKVWMRLDDWNWDDVEEEAEKYEGIGIIECSQFSPLPINLQEPAFVKKPAKRFATETRLIHTHCRPWLLVFKGHPHRSVLTLYERFFPGIEMLKIVVDSGIFQLADIANIRGIKGPPEATVVVNKLATYLLEKKTEKGRSWDPDRLAVPHLRYLRLDGHGGIDPPSPGRITSTVRATATSGFQYFREEWSYYGDDEDLSEAEAYCLYQLALPDDPRLVFTSIRIDVRIGTGPIPDQLFFNETATFPPGYNIFSDIIENLAERHLSVTQESTLEFRLFYRHGRPLTAEIDPIFWARYSKSPHEDGRLRTLQKTIDEDFARCRVLGSCRRCNGQETGVVEI